MTLRVRMRRRPPDLARIASHLNLTVRAVREAARQPDFPVGSDGRYDLDVVRAWFVARARAAASDVSSDRHSRGRRAYGGAAEPGSDSHALTRLREARARTAELALRQKQRELMPVRETAELLARWAVSFKSMLLAIPARLSDRLGDAQRAALKTELMALLTALYEMRDDYLSQAEELGRAEQRGGA